MSAYIVDDSTINRIIAGLKTATEAGWNDNYCKPEADYLHVTLTDADLLGLALWRMNEEAVSQRYPNAKPNEWPGPVGEDGRNPPYNFKVDMPPSPTQFLKSLGCYLYQCSEGDVPETELYKGLRAYEMELALHIVKRSKEYDEAEWE